MKKMILAVLALSAFAVRAEVDKKTERTWKAKCASCHGADGKAQTEQGKKLKIADYSSPEWQSAKKDAELKTAILDGVHREMGGVKQDMDGYKGKISDAEADQLVQYIRTFKK